MRSGDMRSERSSEFEKEQYIHCIYSYKSKKCFKGTVMGETVGCKLEKLGLSAELELQKYIIKFEFIN